MKVATIFLMLLLATSSAPAPIVRTGFTDERGYVHASVLELTENKKKYDGKKVSVVGFFHSEFEFAGLFTREEDVDKWRSETWFFDYIRIGTCAEPPWNYRLEDVNDDYVRVEGIFHFDRHMKGRSEIDKITKFSRIK